jgi:hypothetical protein
LGCQLKKFGKVVNGILLAANQTFQGIELGAAVTVMLHFGKIQNTILDVYMV